MLLTLLAVAACDKPKSQVVAASPTEVTVVTVAPHNVDLAYQYGGRVAAFRQVEVRARVGGILLHREYIEGTRVAAGDELFRIDPAPYQVAVARAAAQLRQQQAMKDKAERDLRRASALLTTQAGSLQARDDDASAVALADAQLAAAEADLRSAALNLSWTVVTAPLGGVTSLEALPEGSLVGTSPGDSLLTRITQTDPIYVVFSFDSDDLDQIRKLSGGAPHLVAHVGVDAPTAGAVDFTDASIDQATGTIRGRARFANPENRLVPGQFVRVTLSGVTLPGAITVPREAVGQDAGGAFVYVAEGGRARRADVTLGPVAGEEWVVDGLRAGDAAIVDGLAHVREGGPVRLVESRVRSGT